MKKLTAEWCEYLLKDLQQKSVTGCGISIKEERYMQALEIALPILEQQELDNAWVEWSGGECPLPADREVEVRYRNGADHTAEADEFSWCYSSEGWSIVAYRAAFL